MINIKSKQGLPARSRHAGVVGMVFVLLLAVVSSALCAPPNREYEIKMAFIYNFAQFIDWPAGTYSSKFVIGIYGKDDYGDAVQVLDKHKIGEANIIVQRVTTLEQAAQCQTLIIGSTDDGNLAQILAGLKGHSVLTVGDQDHFATKGGCIGFVRDRSRMKFDINADALKKANLKASSKLLSLANNLISGGSGQ